MNRSTELKDYIENYRKERICKIEMVLKSKEKELTPRFLSKLDKLIMEQIKRQSEGEQSKTKHLSLCSLGSSSYTESYESYFWLSNSQLYYDKSKSYVYWRPDYLYDNLDSDMKEIERLLRRRFIRIEAFELFALKQKLILDDWMAFETSFCNLAKIGKEVIINSSLQVEDEILILYGDYMERLRVIGRMKMLKGEGHE